MLIHKTRLARKVLALLVTLSCAGLALSVWAMDDEGLAQHDHQPGVDHSRHQQMLQQKGYVRKAQEYQVPDVMLTDQDGRKVSLRAMLGGQEPVMLNFIFTTCTTICPVLSASFTQTQKTLGLDASNVRMISISIDPEHDTPAKLQEYAQRFQARAGWTFLTGDRNDIVVVLKAFDAYRRDKMNHIPLTFMRAAPQADWIRMEGFASAGDLVREFQALTTQGGGLRRDLSLL
jgi:protein SCO1/2